MDFEHKVFANQVPIVRGFVYHLIYHRVLLKGYQKHQLQNEFWTLTIDALWAPKHVRLPFSVLRICHLSQKGQ